MVGAVKTDAERGPHGAWATRARGAVPELTVEQVAAAIRYNVGTVKKIEAGSTGQRPPTRPAWKALVAFYAAVAKERGIVIDPPPVLPRDESADVEVGGSDLAAAIRAQAEAIDRLVDVLERQAADGPAWAQAVVSAVLAGRQLQPGDLERDARGASGAPHPDPA